MHSELWICRRECLKLCHCMKFCHSDNPPGFSHGLHAASLFHAMHHAPCSLLLNESVQFLHRALQDHPLRFFENFVPGFWKEMVAKSLPSIALETLRPKLQLLWSTISQYFATLVLRPSSSAEEVSLGEQSHGVNTKE
jgi:hypothetical protein